MQATNLIFRDSTAVVQKTVNLLVVGSIPTLGASFGLKVFMDAHMPVTHEEGDRYPLRPPEQRTHLEVSNGCE